MRKVIFHLFCLFFGINLFASDSGQWNVHHIPKGEIYVGDYYATGKNIGIEGTVTGDVVVFGSEVFIDGVVDGNVTAMGGAVRISGEVKGNVRIIAGQTYISGKIDGRLNVLSGSTELPSSARVLDNVLAFCGNLDLGGKIGKNARIYASSAKVSAQIAENLIAYVGKLKLTSGAKIDGMLEYWSSSDAEIADRSKIGKGVSHHPPFFSSFFKGSILKKLKIGSQLAAILMNFFYTFCFALLVFRYFPQKIKRSVQVLDTKPIKAFFSGVVLAIVLPLLCLLLLISILGVPFALTLIAINVIGFYTAKIITIRWLMHLVSRKKEIKHPNMYFFLVLAGYYLITLIPFVGFAISIAVMFLGLGALILSKSAKGEMQKLPQ